MGFRHRGKRVLEFTRAEIAVPPPENLPQRWEAAYCDLADVFPLLVPSNHVLDRTKVPGNTITGKDTKMASVTRDLSLDLSPKRGVVPVGLKLHAEVSGSAKYEIVYTLPGGHSYRRFTHNAVSA